ncbi:MAG: S28 family serine protease, partial [Thermocrispum sp.]
MRITIRRAVAMAAAAASMTAVGLAVPAVAAPTAADTAAVQAQGDIVDQLEKVKGLTIVKEEPAPAPGFRFFYLTYRQPVDHERPSKGTFEQRFSLLHRDTSRPMILHTTGYYMPEQAFRAEPTRLVDGNQISVEQRFFEPSRPEPAKWKKLTIEQAAADHHRLVKALEPIYDQEWISTGASKGGMTSVYHRRFYPNDVDGVVAYVAPNDAHNRADRAYDRFFKRVGSTPECQDALETLQQEALKRREELVQRYEEYAAAEGLHFDQVFGSADKAFEMTVLDTAWAFWQYSTEADCATVPPASASTDEIWTFIDTVASFSFYTDEGILPYSPYFYQAATQLGWPSLKFKHLKGLTEYPGLYQANSSLPPELKSRHDPRPMVDVDRWVKRKSSEMLFVYGENDPWGAEPFVDSGLDSFTFTAPGANHGAN